MSSGNTVTGSCMESPCPLIKLSPGGMESPCPWSDWHREIWSHRVPCQIVTGRYGFTVSPGQTVTRSCMESPCPLDRLSQGAAWSHRVPWSDCHREVWSHRVPWSDCHREIWSYHVDQTDCHREVWSHCVPWSDCYSEVWNHRDPGLTVTERSGLWSHHVPWSHCHREVRSLSVLYVWLLPECTVCLAAA